MGKSFWDWIVVTCNGDDLALLGPRNSGKTTLHSYMLQDGLGAPEQTVVAERTAWARNTDLGLNIRRGLDVPGSNGNLADWRAQFKKSTKVFYLFDVRKVRTNEVYAEAVRRHGRQIRDWGPDGRRVMMLGTHTDTDPLAKRLSPAAYLDRTADLEVVAAFFTRAKVKGFAVGSLATADDAAGLVKRALS